MFKVSAQMRVSELTWDYFKEIERENSDLTFWDENIFRTASITTEAVLKIFPPEGVPKIFPPEVVLKIFFSD